MSYFSKLNRQVLEPGLETCQGSGISATMLIAVFRETIPGKENVWRNTGRVGPLSCQLRCGGVLEMCVTICRLTQYHALAPG